GKRKQVTEVVDVKDEASEEQLAGNRGNGEDIIGNDAGGQHIGGSHRRNVEAPQDALLAKGHQCGAQSPKTAHDRQRDDRAEKEPDDRGVPLGDHAREEKEKAEGHDDAEEHEHLIAQRKTNAHSRECKKVLQSRSLRPVSSINTSSSEGVEISRPTSSLPRASRCLTSETMACGGGCTCMGYEPCMILA